MPSSPATVGFQISESLARRARRKPVVLMYKGRPDFVLMSARAYQKLIEQAEVAEDRYWVNVLKNMTPEEKKPIGVEKTRKLLDKVTGRIKKKKK
jgi:PHD/YefM family antitoxin component YafN of YafNO toxin-antitoxin module